MTIFNAIGEEIKTVLNEDKEAGHYQLKLNMNDFPSGIYFYKLTSNGVSLTKKMILVK